MAADIWDNRIVGIGDVAPHDLIANPKNWRKHNRAQRRALEGVMQQVGWVQRVIVNQRTGHVVDGHLRVLLATERNEPSVPVTYVDLDEEEEALVLATLDPIGALAGTDGIALAELMKQITSADEAVQGLLRDLTAQAERATTRLQPEADDVAESRSATVTERGDLWVLGVHRLCCGDAAVRDDLAAVVGTSTAEWVWTDPPYGVDYGTGVTSTRALANDNAIAIPGLLAASFAALDEVMVDGAPFYIAHPPGALAVMFGRAILDVGWHLHQTLIWVKDAAVLGHSDHQYRHEPIYYGWKGARRPWHGGRDQSSVFEIPRPRRSREHPTMKPVALVEAHIRNSSVRDSLGLDPFTGSGTTLIAAERLGRRFAGLELAPAYVDVAVRRWEAYTGRMATLSGDGRSSALDDASVTRAVRGAPRLPRSRAGALLLRRRRATGRRGPQRMFG